MKRRFTDERPLSERPESGARSGLMTKKLGSVFCRKLYWKNALAFLLANKGERTHQLL